MIAIALLFGSSAVTFLAGRVFGWWQLQAWEVFGVAAVLAIPTLLFVPALGVIERWKNERPELYWLVVLLAFLLSGMVIFVAAEWVLGRGSA